VAVHRQRYINITTVSNCDGAEGLWPDALVPDRDVFAREKRNAFPVTVARGRNRVIIIHPIATSQHNSTTLYQTVQISYHIQSLFR
jgi:hypothetical protein